MPATAAAVQKLARRLKVRRGCAVGVAGSSKVVMGSFRESPELHDETQNT
jgi:hypothetical protein